MPAAAGGITVDSEPGPVHALVFERFVVVRMSGIHRALERHVPVAILPTARAGDADVGVRSRAGAQQTPR